LLSQKSKLPCQTATCAEQFFFSIKIHTQREIDALVLSRSRFTDGSQYRIGLAVRDTLCATGLINNIPKKLKVETRAIARRAGLSRNTVRKYLASGVVEPTYARPKAPSKLVAAFGGC